MPRTTGTHRPSSTAGQSAEAFIPFPLPPRDPPLDLGSEIARLHTDALTALARLGVAAQMVPSTDWFLYGFVRKEAVISSQIEGTQATLQDVLNFEATNQADQPEDVEEVCNYVAALKHARAELAKPRGLPISTRLLCEAHRRLMRGSRGSDKAPGQIRRVQNWVGGASAAAATYVPPPPDEVPAAMEAMEKWIHGQDPLPPLVKTGLAHVQFESIHPFLDGNGRMGRLLITLLLEHWGLLTAPVLYLSLALKRRQSEYYARLTSVRTAGDWEGWTVYYLACVRESADDGVRVATELFELIGSDRKRIGAATRSTVAALRLLDLLPEHPVVTGPLVARLLKASGPTARKAIDTAVRCGVLHETSGKQRDRVFAYRKYLKILTGDAE